MASGATMSKSHLQMNKNGQKGFWREKCGRVRISFLLDKDTKIVILDEGYLHYSLKFEKGDTKVNS